jgi:hypothetical protein
MDSYRCRNSVRWQINAAMARMVAGARFACNRAMLSVGVLRRRRTAPAAGFEVAGRPGSMAIQPLALVP